ncbi:hypothetical protein PMIN06_012908 [Paraphaeosphaeria minitans]
MKNEPRRDGQHHTALIDADKIESSCPFLLSVIRETQRLVAIGTLHRRVLEDTIVSADRNEDRSMSYLLKKGTSVLLPVASAHRDPLIWGPTANDFDPNRFLSPQLRDEAVGEENREKALHEENTSARLRKTAYFPFGGGKELCPGRYFAITELLGTMAVLILGYNITAVDGGPLEQPMFGPSKMTASSARPHSDADLRVRIRRRENWEEVIWAFPASVL